MRPRRKDQKLNAVRGKAFITDKDPYDRTNANERGRGLIEAGIRQYQRERLEQTGVLQTNLIEKK